VTRPVPFAVLIAEKALAAGRNARPHAVLARRSMRGTSETSRGRTTSTGQGDNRTTPSAYRSEHHPQSPWSTVRADDDEVRFEVPRELGDLARRRIEAEMPDDTRRQRSSDSRPFANSPTMRSR
jgi:hypothetical protein